MVPFVDIVFALEDVAGALVGVLPELEPVLGEVVL